MNPIEQRLAEIADRMEWMQDNLEGCDWCCGGGDEEWAELEAERERLLSEISPKVGQCENSEK
jgi:DNA repair exonuclease SbcCD ATPase subunit